MITDRLKNTVNNWNNVKGYKLRENNQDIKKSLKARGYTLLDCDFPKIVFTPVTKQVYDKVGCNEVYGVVESDYGLDIVKLENVSVPTTFEAIEQIEHKYQDVVSKNTISFEISVEAYKQMIQYSKTVTENIKQVKEELEETQKQSFAFQEHVDVLTELLKDCNAEKKELLETILGVIKEENKTPVENYQTLLVRIEEVAKSLQNKEVVAD
ncbi:hypothetical protein P4493_06175 [Bacillus thuringiensis]|jgi:hypothetical protein|uniref:Uncharacterized protein n=3 Tax=Bacillus thuringiensis TaxID=1428 RepID=A0A0B5NKN4_BACTU|nr:MULTISPECIES: hypothetical protein [Bacillus]EAO56535.1 hypothetical protein RBTH_05470 [Bacillus thuringiensis serovar israelensis ATCC 35646]MEC2533151.1 hypothetical protein [Bacillus cereus]MED1153869.1 hypothetical protein [Bacillus paranthracis]OUB09280.1 hypothetical protein BK708_32645 [Bacillus thuringiensis serovar yunnanensis]AFQ30178.1 hypothetical protein BTF1_30387 [Bacillus thuringiensis HD-789]